MDRWSRPRAADVSRWRDATNDPGTGLPLAEYRIVYEQAAEILVCPRHCLEFYRVRIPGKPVKYFFGESAWAASRRYAEDAYWKARREDVNG